MAGAQVRRRSYADDVLAPMAALATRFDVQTYGELAYAGDEQYALLALRNHWRQRLSGVLVTGGVHGYETSGVHGALRFLEQHADAFSKAASTWLVAALRQSLGLRTHPALEPRCSGPQPVLPRRPARRAESAALLRLAAPCSGNSWRTSTCTKPPTATSPSSAPRWPRAMANLLNPAPSPTASTWWTTPLNPSRSFSRRSSTRCAHHPHRPGGCPGRASSAPRWRRTGVIRYALKRTRPVHQHHRRALHHHHRGLPRQPHAPRPKQCIARAGGGGVRGDRVRAGTGAGLIRRAGGRVQARRGALGRPTGRGLSQGAQMSNSDAA
jgi:hypothetical protein